MAKVIQLKEVASEFDQPVEMSEPQQSGDTSPVEQSRGHMEQSRGHMEQSRGPETPSGSDQQGKALAAVENPGEEPGACSDSATVNPDTQPLVDDTEPATHGGKASRDGKTRGKSLRSEAEIQRESDHPQQPAASSEANSDTGSHSRLVLQQARESSTRSKSTNEEEDIRKYKIFVIGKTGTGKSSLCNKLVGREDFPTGRSFKLVTTRTKETKTIRSGLDITVVDTQDISSESETKQQEIVDSWKTLAQGFTYIVVLAVRCDQRYSPAEYDVYRQIRKLWGHPDLCRRLVVAFTFADKREDPNVDMKEELKTVWPELKLVMQDAGGRYVLFNNTPGNTEDKGVKELTDMMAKLEGRSERWIKMAKICISTLVGVPFVFVIAYLINECVNSPSFPC